MAADPRNRKKALARKIAIDLSVMTVIGALLAFIGPYGSFRDPLAIRLMVWIGLAWAGYFIYSPVGWVVEKLHAVLELPRLWLWVVGTLIATIPMAIVVWSLDIFLGDLPRWPSPEEALLHYTYVLIIGAGLTILFNVLQSSKSPIESDVDEVRTHADPPKVEDRNRFIERLPPELGSELIALEMEDHYVRAHTALGSDLVLMRMRDAVAELDGMEGLQVHRSWWVARHAVDDVEREGRNVRLVLANGLEAPVSRANVAMLKDAGWI